MPFDVAVEEPDAGVVGAEAQNDVSVRVDHDRVAPHGDRGKSFVVDIYPGFRCAADDGLERVSVKMERVFARVGVVQDDFDDLAFVEDERVGRFSVDGCIGGRGAGGEGGEQGWDLGADVSDVVKPGVVGAVAEIVHGDLEFNGMCWVFEEGLFVDGDQGEIVKGIEFVDESRVGVGFGGIVHEPAGDVLVQSRRDLVEEILIHAADKGEIGRRILFGGDENTVALGGRQVEHLCFRRLGIYAVNLHHLHGMAFKPEILCSKSGHVDDPEQIRLAGLESHGQVLGIVHQGGLWDWFCARRVRVAHEPIEETRHLVVVPVAQGEHDLFVVRILDWRIGVVDDQRATKTVRVLSRFVAVVPVCPGLGNLSHLNIVTSIAQMRSTHVHVVLERCTRRNRTLGHPDRSVHVCGAILVEPMEM